MHKISDIRELAKFLIAAGYRSAFDQGNIPPFQAAIQKVKGAPGSDFVDDLGFVEDKDARRLYLRQRIDLDWLRSNVELKRPLEIDETDNSIFGEYVEICGGGEDPPTRQI